MSTDLNCGSSLSITSLFFFLQLSIFSFPTFPSDQISRVPLRPGADACPSWRPIRSHWRPVKMCGGELAYLWITSPKTQWHMCETVILSGDGALVQGFSYSHRARGLPNPPPSDARFDGCLCDGITLSKSRKAHTSRESGTKSPLSSSKDLSPEHSTHTSIIWCSTLYSPPENSTALNF